MSTMVANVRVEKPFETASMKRLVGDLVLALRAGPSYAIRTGRAP